MSDPESTLSRALTDDPASGDETNSTIAAADDATPAVPPRGRHYNWPAIKADYVEGVDEGGRIQWLSLDECAARHDASPGKVRRRAADEHWTDERATFQRRIEEQRQDERSNEIASLGSDLDVSALRIARAGMTLTASRIGELSARAAERNIALNAARDGDGKGTTAELDAPPPVNAQEVQRLAGAARDWYELGSKALGDTPTVVVAGNRTRPVEVHHEHEGEARDVYIREILAVLIDAGQLPEALRDLVGEQQPPAAFAELVAGTGQAEPVDGSSAEAH